MGLDTKPDSLQYLNIETLSKAKCRGEYDMFYYRQPHSWHSVMNILPGKILCTKSVFGIGPWKGDSGSPLVVNGVLVGIFAATIGCAKGNPDIYTNIYEHQEWIATEMQRTILE